MRRVDRSEILTLNEYERVRPQLLERLIRMKQDRRVSVGEHMTFIFESRDTVIFQIEEMLRVERITREEAIQHEIDTYNALIPAEGDLSATLMIEYEDPEERRVMLTRLVGLKNCIALRVGGRSFPARFQEQPGEDAERIPAVNYVRFLIGTEGARFLGISNEPAWLAVSHAAYRAEAELTMASKKALAADLDSRRSC